MRYRHDRHGASVDHHGGAGAESAATRATDARGGTFELLHPESRHHAVLAGGGPGALWVALRLYPVQRAGCRAQSARRRIGFNPACIQKSLCAARSEEHTSELQSLMHNSYAVFCLTKKIKTYFIHVTNIHSLKC